MPGLIDFIRRPTVGSAAEFAQLWSLPGPELDNMVDWEPCTFLPPPQFAFIPDYTTPRPRKPDALPTVGDYPIRLAQAERPDGTYDYVGMLARDFLTAMTIMAPMGTGKTHLAKIILGEMLRIGAGVSVTDFKADLVTDMLDSIVTQDKETSTWVVDIADTAWPVAINPLMQPGADVRDAGDRGRMADGLQALISRFDESFAQGPGMQEFARNACLALVEAEPTPDLLKLHRFMLSEPYRMSLVDNIHDGMVREFWVRDFPARGEQAKSSVDALIRRFGMFLMNPVIRHVVCRSRTTLDYRKAMDHGHIVLASIPVETIGVKIGGFAAMMIQELLNAAAFSRAADKVPVDERRFFLNLIDEFQQAVNSGDPAAVATQISKLRAMGVGSVYLYQSSAQIPPDLRIQIESNVANAICLGAMGGDIPTLTQRWGTHLSAADFAGMRRREDIYLQIQMNEQKTPPFRARSMPLWPSLKESSLGAAPREDWREVRAPITADWHAWMDEKIAGIQDYERAATIRRDEARALESQANLLDRGQTRAADAHRDRHEKSRGEWPNDAQELRDRAFETKRMANDLERAPLQLLITAPGRIFDLYRERSAQHRKAQHAFISENPAAIPDTRERITWLSRLTIAEPQIEVAAYVERTIAQLEVMESVDDGAKRGKGKDRDAKPAKVAPRPGQAVVSSTGNVHIKGLGKMLEDDTRSVEQVIKDATGMADYDADEALLATVAKDPHTSGHYVSTDLTHKG